MGSSFSNAGDRRTNALRRSQRKSITGACTGIDKLLKTIKKFEGTQDSDQYKNLRFRIAQIELKLQQKAKEPQPQFVAMHKIALAKIKTAYDLLEERTIENQLPATPPKPPEKIDENSNETTTPPRPAEPSPEPQSPTDSKRNSLLWRLTKIAAPKRESLETEVEIHRSPETTRRSIMKYGVQVLPSPITSNAEPDPEKSAEKNVKRLKIIKQDIAHLEIRISEFVGKKNGKHYNNLKGALTQLIAELEEVEEEELLDQVIQCHNYIKSCLDFLDSKAVEGIDDDDVENYNDSRIYGSTHDLLEGHAVRTTAI